MEGIEIRTTTDLDLLVESRMLYVRGTAHGGEAAGPGECAKAAALADTEALQAVKRYMAEQVEKGAILGFIGRIGGRVGGRIACSAGLLLYELPPLMGQLHRVQGHVLSVWVEPEFRRKGLGETLMRELIAESKRRGVGRLFLNATAMGEGLYRKLGFAEQEEKALILRL
jgi:ribosomal protein S18 acetylase RimI-like enzyme